MPSACTDRLPDLELVQFGERRPALEPLNERVTWQFNFPRPADGTGFALWGGNSPRTPSVDEFEGKYPKAEPAEWWRTRRPCWRFFHADRALVGPTDLESDRIAVRDGAAAAACEEGGGLADQGAVMAYKLLEMTQRRWRQAERRAPAPPRACRSPLRRWRARGTRPVGSGGRKEAA